MKTLFLALLFVSMVSVVGAGEPEIKPLPWDVSDGLSSSSPLILYSLDPSLGGDPNGFHGWKVLGQTQITDAETRKRVATAIIDSVAHAKQFGARCFNPHHALRFSKGTVTYDLVICFECSKVVIYTTGVPTRERALSREGDKVLDAVFSAARVPVVKRLQN